MCCAVLVYIPLFGVPPTIKQFAITGFEPAPRTWGSHHDHGGRQITLRGRRRIKQHTSFAFARFMRTMYAVAAHVIKKIQFSSVQGASQPLLVGRSKWGPVLIKTNGGGAVFSGPPFLGPFFSEGLRNLQLSKSEPLKIRFPIMQVRFRGLRFSKAPISRATDF
jgi:hypothetical protein